MKSPLQTSPAIYLVRKSGELNKNWLWIRTWYGEKDEEVQKVDQEYAHLVDRVFEECPENLDEFEGVTLMLRKSLARMNLLSRARPRIGC